MPATRTDLARVLALLGITPHADALQKQLAALDEALDALLVEFRDVDAVEKAAAGSPQRLIDALLDARNEASTLRCEHALRQTLWSRYADNLQNLIADMQHNGMDCMTDEAAGFIPEECFVCKLESAAADRPDETE